MEFQISLQTIRTTAAGSLKSVKPNDEGFYCGIPVAILGMPSRNNVYYEPSTVVEAMRNKDTKFFKAISGGGLDGEWGHPDVSSLSGKVALERIATVLEGNVSHYFNRIYSKSLGDGTTAILGDVKPFGPMGKFLKESFDDANHDTCFSLRSITSKPIIKNNLAYKKVLAMITFDGVSVPGYEKASKRMMEYGTEGMLLEFEDTNCSVFETTQFLDDPTFKDTIGFENVNSQQVMDVLKTDNITVSFESKTLGIFDSDTGTIRTDKRRKSIFHSLAFGD